MHALVVEDGETSGELPSRLVRHRNKVNAPLKPFVPSFPCFHH